MSSLLGCGSVSRGGDWGLGRKQVVCVRYNRYSQLKLIKTFELFLFWRICLYRVWTVTFKEKCVNPPELEFVHIILYIVIYYIYYTVYIYYIV